MPFTTLRRPNNAVCLAMLVAVAGIFAMGGSVSEAAPCPAATPATVCVDLTEPSMLASGQPMTNYLKTNVYLSKNGVALPVVSIPATSASGGGVVSTTLQTSACVKDTYSATAKGENTAGEGAAAGPITTTKDRLAEPPCLVPGTIVPFGIR